MSSDMNLLELKAIQSFNHADYSDESAQFADEMDTVLANGLEHELIAAHGSMIRELGKKALPGTNINSYECLGAMPTNPEQLPRNHSSPPWAHPLENLTQQERAAELKCNE